MNKISIILLAGGSSSRFKPLKEKNLYKFIGKSLIQWQLEQLKQYPIENIIIITNQNNNEQISTEVKKYKFSKIITLIQKGDGQSGAVTTALNNIKNPQDILIINMNDIFTNKLFEDFFKKLPKLQKLKHNMLTGYHIKEYFPGGYLVVKSGNIVKVIEKPGEGNEPSNYVRIVFDYFHNSHLLQQALEKAKSQNDDVYEIALSNMMSKGEIFEMLEYKEFWGTIKYPWHVLNLMNYFLGQITKPKISKNVLIAKSAKINGNVIIEDGVKIFDNAVINGPVYIGRNAIIGNNALVRDSIIGDNSVIGFASEVARSYLKSNVWLHMNYIGDSIIEDNVSFGSTSLTANFRLDESMIKVNVKGEKINTKLTKLGAIIGSNVRIGVEVKTMPGIKIGSNSIILPGIILSQDIKEDSFVKSTNGKLGLKITKNKLNIKNLKRDKLKKQLN